MPRVGSGTKVGLVVSPTGRPVGALGPLVVGGRASRAVGMPSEELEGVRGTLVGPAIAVRAQAGPSNGLGPTAEPSRRRATGITARSGATPVTAVVKASASAKGGVNAVYQVCVGV